MTSVALAPCYLFGIVPAVDVAGGPIAGLPPPTPDTGITGVRFVTAGPLAAVIGSAPLDRPIGRAADLRTHDAVLAALVAAGIPVLPFRFGAVVADERAVAEELLGPHRDGFVSALERLVGRVQYTLQARYEQDTVLREVLAQHPDIAGLRQDPDRADPGQQLRLGQLVVRALELRRPDDAAAVTGALRRVSVALRTREPDAPDVVLAAAVLVDRNEIERFERAVEDIGRAHAGRLRLRLVGPVAPYDFTEEG